MLFNKIKRCSCKARNQYSREVQEYLRKNALNLIRKISDGVLNQELTDATIKLFLGKDYPKAPWITEDDLMGHLTSILKEAGYIFTCTNNRRVILRNLDVYNVIVKNHLRFSGAEIVSRLAQYCEKTYGRLTYQEVREVLGFHYPKPPYIEKTDERVCIIAFLRETGVPFKYDETHIYFP